MSCAGRVQDEASCPADSHGCIACAHAVHGPALAGSTDIVINQRSALRVGDPGAHSGCCGPNRWVAASGSSSVIFNGRSAHRKGDRTSHCGGSGQLVEGSDNVVIEEGRGADAAIDVDEPVPHERSLRVRLFDGHGRKISAIRLRVTCPHRDDRVVEFDHDHTVVDLCDDALLVVDKQLQFGGWDE